MKRLIFGEIKCTNHVKFEPNNEKLHLKSIKESGPQLFFPEDFSDCDHVIFVFFPNDHKEV